MLPLIAQAASEYTNFANLGLDPVALQLGPMAIKWYSLAYIVGIFAGYFLLRRMLQRPGAPMAARHLDDLLFYAMLGIILGGRLGYVFFYAPEMLQNPLSVFKLWEGGMAFHGGALGVILAVLYVARKNGISFIRILDYVACVAPIGLFLGRIANFINGELWGRPTDVPWAVIFPQSGTSDPRHPSQLYEAGLEGIMLFVILTALFWLTRARYKPGFLAGVFGVGYALSRFALEFVREPDAQLGTLSWGLTMGQTLSLPLLIGGLYLILTSGRRTPVTVRELPADADKGDLPA